MKIATLLFLFIGILLSSNAPCFAKTFHNSFLSFDLPPSWNCERRGRYQYCTPARTKNGKKKGSILVMAKKAGPQDNLPRYKAHLAQPKMNKLKQTSHVLKVDDRTINGHSWIDALHLGAELDHYYSRYLATVKNKLAIMVLLTAHEKHYSDMSGVFVDLSKSIQVKNQFSIKIADQPNGLVGGVNRMGSATQPGFDVAEPLLDQKKPGRFNLGTKEIIAIALLAAAFIIYLYWKLTDSPKKRRTKRKRRR